MSNVDQDQRLKRILELLEGEAISKKPVFGAWGLFNRGLLFALYREGKLCIRGPYTKSGLSLKESSPWTKGATYTPIAESLYANEGALLSLLKTAMARVDTASLRGREGRDRKWLLRAERYLKLPLVRSAGQNVQQILY